MEQLLAARGTGLPERWLARIRDALVAPFGLKPIGKRGMAPFERLELNAEEANYAIYAIDDRHVDVRIAYRSESRGGGNGYSWPQRLSASTAPSGGCTCARSFRFTFSSSEGSWSALLPATQTLINLKPQASHEKSFATLDH